MAGSRRYWNLSGECFRANWNAQICLRTGNRNASRANLRGDDADVNLVQHFLAWNRNDEAAYAGVRRNQLTSVPKNPHDSCRNGCCRHENAQSRSRSVLPHVARRDRDARPGADDGSGEPRWRLQRPPARTGGRS